MSKPFDASDPASAAGGDPAFEIRELRRACAELDSQIPNGYFDSFSTKLADKLATKRMETRDSEPGSRDGAQPLSPPAIGMNADQSKRDEHSGLHEIKALASSARERIRRRSTENDIQESMLATSSSGMAAVVLPDPERSSPSVPLLSDASQLSMASSQSMPKLAPVSLPSNRMNGGERAKSKQLPWLWIASGAVGIAAAVAAIALVVLDNNTSDEDNEQIAAVSNSDTADVNMGATPAPPPQAAPARAKDAPSISASAEAEESEDANFAVGLEGADGQVDSDGASAQGSSTSGGLLGKAETLKRERKSETLAAKRTESARAQLAQKKAKEANKGGAEASSLLAEANKSAVRANENEDKERAPTGDIDSILDEVAGGGSQPADVEEKGAKPDRKALSSSDVRRAMGRLQLRVNKCGAKTGFTGKVSTRFSVSPSGRVTKASAKGGDATVNSCVKAAVKSAKFPTFEPPVASFSYPFLITD